jgi:hypothetical protein
MASHRRCNISTAIRSQHNLEGVLESGIADTGCLGASARLHAPEALQEQELIKKNRVKHYLCTAVYRDGEKGFAMSDVVSKNLLVTALDRTLSGML